jgi:L-serine dehydratase
MCYNCAFRQNNNSLGIFVDTIRKIYKIGYGPSSSHTMGPKNAAIQFKERTPEAKFYRVTLYGSLAATGRGHLTDIAILDALQPATAAIVWQPQEVLPFHPNGMKFEALDDEQKLIAEWIIYSIGGGELANEDIKLAANDVYELHTAKAILEWCEKYGKSLWQYVVACEGESIFEYLAQVWKVMQEAIARGLNKEGFLPGALNLPRKASAYHKKAYSYRDILKNRALVYSYALAVAEENAGGGLITTAPTCGSAGILPAVLYFLYKNYELAEKEILKALATAGLFGNMVKTNASISGAEVGCQGEVGVACAMAAAAANQLSGGTVRQVEYAAEMGLEHHLGLTCDPVCELVQVPCIERNAFAAVRALDAGLYASLSDGQHLVSFDRVVEAMRQTGHDLPSIYKETSEGGLAKVVAE